MYIEALLKEHKFIRFKAHTASRIYDKQEK